MIRFFHFHIPLVRPLVLRHATLHEREGIILEIRDQHGHRGLGECSPLPGFFSESVADCIQWLSANKSRVEHGEIPDSPPSLQSAVAQARLFLSCHQEHHTPLQKLGITQNSCPVNALLTGDREQILEKSERLASNGFTAAKLKVGRGGVEEDIDLVTEVRARIPRSIALRLDANHSWSFRDAFEFSKRIDWSGIEYCEEPLSDPSKLNELKREFPSVRIALDESFVAHGEQIFSIYSDPVAVILRPQMLGGFEATREIMRRLADRGIARVISSAAESSLGMLTVLLCALSGSSPITPAGLDTLSWLADDTVEHPLLMQQGKIDWPDWWQAIRINEGVGEWHEL